MWRASGSSKVASLFCLFSCGLFRHFSLAGILRLRDFKAFEARAFEKTGLTVLRGVSNALRMKTSRLLRNNTAAFLFTGGGHEKRRPFGRLQRIVNYL